MNARVWAAIVATALTSTAAVTAVVTVSAAHTRGIEVRASSARPQPAPPPVEHVVDGVRHMAFGGAPELLLPDSTPPTEPAVLLWLDGRRASPTPDGAVVLDAAGGVVEFDRSLHPRQRVVRGEGREWLSVASALDGGLWLTDATGGLFRADSAGMLHPAPRLPFAFAEVATDPARGTPWLVRSWHRFSYAIPPEGAPLLVQADDRGASRATLGRATRPEHVLLADLANAGTMAVADRALFFAPFIRDELVAMSWTGDTLWTATRGLPQSTKEPKFELLNGKAIIAYHPVNLGLTLGPDGRLYLLSTPGPTTLRSRLDVFDPQTGRLLRSAELGSATPTLAVDPRGRVYVLDPFRVMAGVALKQREMVPEIDLPALGGGRVTFPAPRGRVVLLNLWASWCGPCREEMPALDSLRRTLQGPEFEFVGLNDDVDVEAAKRFVKRRGFDFVVALGRGKVKELFHASGLPVTVLVDREGREVRRWIGYDGAAQIDQIRALARAEIDRVPAPDAHHHHAH